MGSTPVVTSQLQVLPQSVHFNDVESEQQLYTTVTVKVYKVKDHCVPRLPACFMIHRLLEKAIRLVSTFPPSPLNVRCALQNLDSRQRLLRWKAPKTMLFRVQGLATVSKLAPGLQLSFKVIHYRLTDTTIISIIPYTSHTSTQQDCKTSGALQRTTRP